MKRITPCLWFDSNAEDAAKFYVRVFKPRGGARLGHIARYGAAVAERARRPAGSVMTVMFELDGQPYMGLNGGPPPHGFKFTEAISLMVNCDTQAELDRMWAALSADGGQEVECGWLKDKFGLSWQIVPAALDEMMNDSDQDKVDRVMTALLGMKKLDIATLKRAYEGK